MFPRDLTEFILKIDSIFKSTQLDGMGTTFKGIDDPVTIFDLQVSKYVTEQLNGSQFQLIDEEGVNRDFSFPLVILDPLDGTREFVNNVPEFAVSMATMISQNILDPQNQAFIYNPANKIKFTQDNLRLLDIFSVYENKILVSRTEYKDKLFIDNTDDVIAVGSIAYKLAILASGNARAVVSRRDKNIWDIAAGTILASRSGYHFYEQGKKVEQLDRIIYRSPLIWCREADCSEIQKNFDF